MTGRRDQGNTSSGSLLDTPLGQEVQRTIAENALVLRQAPATARASAGGLRSTVADGLGKVWNGPNTVIGLGYGLAGHLAGELNRLRPGDQPDPRIQVGHNAVEFINNPAGGLSAITIGNATIYKDDAYAKHNEAYRAHEQAHTRQGQQLGPAYLPSNLAGGLWAVAKDGEWHGDHNWNERGPSQSPPRRWAPMPVRK